MPKCSHCGKFVIFGFNKTEGLCKKCQKEKPLISKKETTVINTVNNSNSNTALERYLPDPFIGIPSDILDLIWFIDGSRKNFIAKEYKFSKTINDVKISVTIPASLNIEPSAISIQCPIAEFADLETPRPCYYPTYIELSPEQKFIYLQFLKNVYNPNVDIGYVFIFYYGLERHLFEGNFESAYQVIKALRIAHRNKSFQEYSANALFLSCLLQNKLDLIRDLFRTFDIDDSATYLNINLFIALKLLLSKDFSAKELICYARRFDFKNTQYIKKHPELFEKFLQIELDQKPLLTPFDPSTLTYIEFPIYANQILSVTTQIPDYIHTEYFQLIGQSLLQNALEKTKEYIKNNKQKGDTHAKY